MLLKHQFDLSFLKQIIQKVGHLLSVCQLIVKLSFILQLILYLLITKIFRTPLEQIPKRMSTTLSLHSDHIPQLQYFQQPYGQAIKHSIIPIPLDFQPPYSHFSSTIWSIS